MSEPIVFHTCICDEPYFGTQVTGSILRCERCGGAFPKLAGETAAQPPTPNAGEVRRQIECDAILALMGKEPYLAKGHVENGEHKWTVVADKISVTELRGPLAASTPAGPPKSLGQPESPVKRNSAESCGSTDGLDAGPNQFKRGFACIYCRMEGIQHKVGECPGAAPAGAKRPINRPCSACSAGDYKMEYHDHQPPFSDAAPAAKEGAACENCEFLRGELKALETKLGVENIVEQAREQGRLEAGAAKEAGGEPRASVWDGDTLVTPATGTETQLRDALGRLMKYDFSNAYPHMAADWDFARAALAPDKLQPPAPSLDLKQILHVLYRGRTMVNFHHVPEVTRAIDWLSQDFRKALDEAAAPPIQEEPR